MATIANDTQFIGISPTIDLTGKKSAILNEQTIPVTMDDITSTVRPYNVFTALLTQSGGSVVDYVNWDDDPNTLTIGVTYTITGNDDNSNFIPNGAPNNNVGTSFIATSSVVAWGTGNTGDNQVSYNTGAPVATVLENTIGNIWFTYNGVGIYSIRTNELTPLFTYNKTVLFNQTKPSDDFAISMLMYYVEEFKINIQTYSDSTLSDDVLYVPTTIEIRVYE